MLRLKDARLFDTTSRSRGVPATGGGGPNGMSGTPDTRTSASETWRVPRPLVRSPGSPIQTVRAMTPAGRSMVQVPPGPTSGRSCSNTTWSSMRRRRSTWPRPRASSGAAGWTPSTRCKRWMRDRCPHQWLPGRSAVRLLLVSRLSMANAAAVSAEASLDWPTEAKASRVAAIAGSTGFEKLRVSRRFAPAERSAIPGSVDQASATVPAGAEAKSKA